MTTPVPRGLLVSLAGLGGRRPVAVVAVFAALVVLAAALAHRLDVSTSRYGLVSPKNPHQARLLAYFARFGYPDVPVFVVTGGTPEQRRQAIDAVAAKLERVPELSGRVLARVGGREVAEVLLLQEPGEVLRALPAAGAAETLEGGIPSWLGSLRGQLDAGLEGRGKDEAGRADAGLLQLARLARALSADLSGGRAMRELPADGALAPGLDEQGYLVGTTGDTHLCAVFPVLAGDEGSALHPLVTELRRLRDEALREQQLPVHMDLTGPPALAVDELRVLERGLYVSTLASSLGIAVLLLVVFRNLRYVGLTLAGMGVGVTLTLGAVRLVYGGLNLITSSFVSVLLGLGDFSVYVLSRYSELRRAGAPEDRAMALAFHGAGPGIVTGAITTALAFGTTSFVEFTAFAELGVISALGIAAILLTTFLLLPAAARLVERPSLSAAPAPPLVTGLPSWVRRGSVPITVGAVALTVFAGTRAARVRYDGRYFDFLPQTTESARGLVRLERDPVLSPVFAALTGEGVEEARAIAQALRGVPSVASVQSPVDLLPLLHPARLASLRELARRLGGFRPEALRRQSTTSAVAARSARDVADALDEVAFALTQGGRSRAGADAAKQAFVALARTLDGLPGDGKDELARVHATVADVLGRALMTASAVAARGSYVPQDLPPLFRPRFVSKDGQALAVYAFPRENVWELERGERFAREVASVEPGATGLAVTIFEHERMITRGFYRSTALALLLVLLVLGAAFRSARYVALALVPLALGAIWMFGAMHVVGLDLDVANVVALPLLLGLSVDAGAQIVHRHRESAASRGGASRLEDVLHTGAAVALVSGTTIVGFAALLFSEHGGARSFGLAMTLGMTGTLLASLFVLPALLRLLRLAE